MVQQAGGDRILSDKWNWRKYGEKVIKGSPNPRFLPLSNYSFLIFILHIPTPNLKNANLSMSAYLFMIQKFSVRPCM